jgi:hypothetical protein
MIILFFLAAHIILSIIAVLIGHSNIWGPKTVLRPPLSICLTPFINLTPIVVFIGIKLSTLATFLTDIQIFKSFSKWYYRE